MTVGLATDGTQHHRLNANEMEMSSPSTIPVQPQNSEYMLNLTQGSPQRFADFRKYLENSHSWAF